jgi:hypothetical protein
MSTNELIIPTLEDYTERPKKKKIFLLADDIRMHSGIATMSKEVVIGTAHKYDWVQLGALQKHPEQGKILDISQDVNKEAGIDHSSVRIYPWSGYGDPRIFRTIMEREKPDAVMIFTDPRYWMWLFSIEQEVRQQVPIIYYNIWDDLPYPHWNEKFYRSVDMLLNISKQTQNLVEQVLSDDPKEDGYVRYVPHGINSKHFHPVDKEDSDFIEFKNKFRLKDTKFNIFWNNRNIRRKNPGDVVLSYKHFCDNLSEEEVKNVRLILHTAPSDPNGTDLMEVVKALRPKGEVVFSREKFSTKHLNYMYNVADVVLNIASNEGFGLSSAESIMAGTMVINNVTGGLQDQLRFEDSDKNWIEFSEEFPSNHTGIYKNHGSWGIGVFPTNRSLQGSVVTPYIFDDRCSFEDVGKALLEVFKIPQEERNKRGLEGRNWLLSDESGLSAKKMCANFLDSFEFLFENWESPSRFILEKIGPEKNITKLGLLYG